MVVMNGPEAIAGSTFIFSQSIGMEVPISTAIIIATNIEMPTTIENSKSSLTLASGFSWK